MDGKCRVWAVPASGVRPRGLGLAAVAAAGLVLCSCGGGPTRPHRSWVARIVGSVSPTVSPSAVDDRASVEAAYRRFWWTTETFVSHYRPPQWRQVLAGVTTDPMLTRLLAGGDVHRRNGIVVYGHAVPHVRAVLFDGPGRATVTDCLDASHTGQASAKTGARRTVGVARSPVTAVVVRGRDGLWRVADARFTGGEC